MKDPKKAFKWIVDILNKHNVQFLVVGGLAAKAYGAVRELIDIDLYISGKNYDKIINDVKEFIVFGPGYHKGKQWHLIYLKLNYHDQIIEIGDADSTKILDENTQEWVKESPDLNGKKMEVFGIEVPVIPKEKLIEYKMKLNRDVDKQDIKEMINL